ncbi:NADPH-dependent FMN reductase [uncultured Tessaracoccus sp.]|uniref:NADPH-dependent FMN reductase n=1 Tax=uncultured Tessaracoccus sp. TaxID=905023 RepID=UPI0025DE6B07|nr:NAD(P)H-dependent oxidoreductase [uncultured Tessaracoccus sp.]
MKVGIISGSVREGRRSTAVAEWLLGLAPERDDVEFEVLELARFQLPVFTSEVQPARANREYADEAVRAWSQAVDACDGFVFVTPEYNHGVPGAFKNAFDSLAPEWSGKPVGFASYGSSHGARAVEQWRGIVATLGMLTVGPHPALSIFTDVDASGVQSQPVHEDKARAMFDGLLRLLDRLA